MILASLVGCVMAALLLSLTAATSLALLHTGVGVIGFFISLQFASGHLKHLNANLGQLCIPIVSKILFLDFLLRLLLAGRSGGSHWARLQRGVPWRQPRLAGYNNNIMLYTHNNGHYNKVFPPLAGMVIFSPAGPMSVFYLTLGLSAAHLLVFICLFRMSFI